VVLSQGVGSIVLSAEGVVLQRAGSCVGRLPSFQLARGETMALCGPSGAGKTTGLLALAGLAPPSAGQICVDGTFIWDIAASARDRLRGRKIGFVFQTFHLVDAMTVEQNLALASQCAELAVDTERNAQLLAEMGVAHLWGRRPSQLSQGEAQRVAVARALVNAPAVILADEPTSALDDDNASKMINLMCGVARHRNAALLLVTHDRRVRDCVDRALEIEGP